MGAIPCVGVGDLRLPVKAQIRVSWEILASKFNHSSPSVTRSYLGIQDDEVNNILVHCPI